MTWGLVDDGLHDHAKVLSLSDPRTMGTWLVAFSWCCRHRNTAGHISASVLLVLLTRPGRAATPASVEADAAELVRVGLWEPAGPNGWRFHDWADWAGRGDTAVESAPASPARADTTPEGGCVEATSARPMTRSEVNRANAKARWERSRIVSHPVSHPFASVSHAGSHPMQTGFASGSHDANEGGGGEISDPILSDPSQNQPERAGAGGGGRIRSHPESHAFASASHDGSHANSHPVASHAIASGSHASSPPDGSPAPDSEAGVTRAARTVTLCRMVEETQYEKGLGVPFGPLYRVLAELLRLPELRESRYREEATKVAKQLVALATGQSLGSYEIQPHVEEAMDRLGRLLVDEPMRPSRAIGWVNTTAKGLFREDPTGEKWGKAQPSKAPTEAA